MTPFEYLLPFVSILVGLAVADLSVSLHRLLRARRLVRWDWLPLGAALLVLLLVLQFWWAFYSLGRIDVWAGYGPFVLLTFGLIAIVLLASAALPDAVPPEGLDMRTYYEENRPYFWTLFAAFLGIWLGINLVMAWGRMAPADFIGNSLPNLVLAGVFLALARVRSRGLHAAVIVGVLLVAGLLWTRMRLSLPA